MKISEVIHFLESIADPSLQEQYDNAGLITGDAGWECSGIICSLDATEEVVREAIAKKCNCIVAHHPIIFGGLKKINGKNYVEKSVIAAIKNEIAIYAIHTNLDNVAGAVNGKIASKLGIHNGVVLAAFRSAHPYKEIAYDLVSLSNEHRGIGSGLIGTLPMPIDEARFLAGVKDVFKVPVIRHSAFRDKPVQRIAVCGGAGSFLIPAALAAGADAYITSDLKYHEFFDANGRMLLADIGHYESEQFTIELLQEVLGQKFLTFAVLKTEVETNPVRYFK